MIESLEQLVEANKRILVFGAGGGGDALGAVHLYIKLSNLGAEPLLGSIVWERFILDPHPGPIPIEALIGAERIGWSLALVNGNTKAIRFGRELKPQVVRIAGALGIEALYIDASKGGEGVLQALRDAIDKLGVEAVIGLDTGGDIIARGCEEDLWSPLADAMSLYALASIDRPSLIALLSPGADGELPMDTVLRYISAIASRGGLIGVYGLTRSEYRYMRELSKHTISEASLIPLRAFEGEHGEALIRGKTRRVAINPVSAATFILDPKVIYEWTPLGKAVKNTRSVKDASRALNEMCIYTELDLEEDLSQLSGSTLNEPRSILEIRSLGRQRIIRRGCNPVSCP
ncbi:MAG: DUF1152 domain-containing protein [Desulfurococcales archaeon]|nr:DUF1152 domain-containing protein [Desulfurococcales archaeon]